LQAGPRAAPIHFAGAGARTEGAGWNGRSLPDLIKAKTTVTLGATSPTAITSQHPLFFKNMVGANLKVIYGHKGTKDVLLAMMRGEVDGSCGMFASSVRRPSSLNTTDFALPTGLLIIPFL
jgi:hypothetical protein